MTKTNGHKSNGHRIISWARRVVPESYAKATLILNGTSPYLMNPGDIDRHSDTYRAYQLLGKKRGKSLEDVERLSELEWMVKLQLDAEIGPYVPGRNIKELLKDAATKWRKGEEIKRSLVALDYRIPLLYDGPRDQDGLWEAGYLYTTLVKNAGASRGSVLRTRPKFEHWAVAAELAYDPEDLDLDLLGAAADRAMKYGLGDYRPDFGAFTATLEAGELSRAATNGSALKPRDREQLLAHVAFTERILAGAAA